MTTKPKGVMIVGRKMPMNCIECPCSRVEVHLGNLETVCVRCNVFNKETRKTKRPSWCPLKEVK